jgi:hypothetical protein
MKGHGETFDDVVHSVAGGRENIWEDDESKKHIPAPDNWLDVVFNDGFGGPEGHPFTVWTGKRVYFPTEYDGAESVDSVPRDPCDEVKSHV